MPLDRRGQWYRYHHLFRDMLLAELERQAPGLLPVLRRRAAGWCLRNDWPEEALEYFMAAGDIDAAARLVQEALAADQPAGPGHHSPAVVPVAGRPGRDRGTPDGRRLAAFVAAQMGRPAEAERWADAVDRWQYGDASRPDDPAAEAWAAILRAILCRRGVKQMRADADEAVRKVRAAGMLVPAATLLQGLARVLSGDLEGGDASFEDAISAERIVVPEILTSTLCERSLLAMERGEWSRAEAFTARQVP